MQQLTRLAFIVATIVAASVVVVAVVWVASSPRLPFDRYNLVEKWHRIQVGMPLRDAQLILGGPSEEIPIADCPSPFKVGIGNDKICYRWKSPSGFFSGKQETDNELYIAVAHGRVTSTGIWGPSLGMHRDR